ncbi:DUF4360 domain-containing protein [Spartinivicinus poritis]|uniref:DUF4360 domain-containing protein n=1 Tax=Spartinivicinus poritis TaxID=2994640 RepID=A0ABT5U6J6_9GAMM|nr:DUF4360 domain-containing protein [Spartinivicinus sp. A2-2]MDE1461975.1 DUF4360 domain-containing protein [Spartinivicinus sp. A2-2]
MLTIKSLRVGLICSAFLVAGQSAQATDFEYVTPPEGQVKVKGIIYGGSGCPQNSIATSVAKSGLNFGISFDNYVAGIGDGFARHDKRKNCELRVELAVPSGYSYSIVDANYRGYADLDSGINGTFVSRYHFQGELSEATLNRSVRGPINRDFTVSDSLDVESFVWSDCGATAPVVLTTQLNLKKTHTAGSNAEGVVGLDSVEGKLTHRYGLKWKRCNS